MILVTGGAGYIGSHTVKALRESGFEPLIFDNFSTGHRSFVGNTKLVEGNLTNPEDLRSKVIVSAMTKLEVNRRGTSDFNSFQIRMAFLWYRSFPS